MLECVCYYLTVGIVDRTVLQPHRIVMVNYKQLQKPTIPNWPNIPRQLKFAIAFALIIIVTCVLIFGTSRNSRLAKIYNVQASLADIFDLQMKYIRENSHLDKNEWLPVDDLDGHVYSAYLDVRPEVIDHYSHEKNEIVWSLVRIIAILPIKVDADNVECIYKYGNEREGYIEKRRSAMSVRPMEENWSLKYSAFFVICHLEMPDFLDHERIYNVTQIPKSIAIGLAKTKKFNFVDVLYPTMGMNQLYEPANTFMAICVPVLHHSFNRPLDLVEFVEYYLLLGASHFTFYNSSITPEVSRVLEYYKKRQIASVLSWKLPSKYIFEKTLRFEGLFAGLNDCLYRNSFHANFEYIASVGTDEFLVPRIHKDFFDLIEYLDPYKNNHEGRYASFLIRNVFFYTMYEDDRDNKDPKVPYLYTQAKTWRLRKPHEAGSRSRYIVRGRDVVELGNYRVVEMREGSSTFPKPFEEIAVETNVALSHQYAPCEAEETGCYLKSIEIDKTAHKFTKKLGTAVATACNDIFGPAGCPFVKKQTLA